MSPINSSIYAFFYYGLQTILAQRMDYVGSWWCWEQDYISSHLYPTFDLYFHRTYLPDLRSLKERHFHYDKKKMKVSWLALISSRIFEMETIKSVRIGVLECYNHARQVENTISLYSILTKKLFARFGCEERNIRHQMRYIFKTLFTIKPSTFIRLNAIYNAIYNPTSFVFYKSTGLCCYFSSGIFDHWAKFTLITST